MLSPIFVVDTKVIFGCKFVAPLKISWYSQESNCAVPSRISFTEHLRWLLLDFRGSKCFFSSESCINCWQWYQFLLGTPLKTRDRRQKQPLKLFCKKGFLRHFASLAEKRLCWSPFLIALQTFRPAASLKRDSNVFLRNLQNF